VKDKVKNIALYDAKQSVMARYTSRLEKHEVFLSHFLVQALESGVALF